MSASIGRSALGHERRLAARRPFAVYPDSRHFDDAGLSSVKKSQVVDLESGNGAVGPLSLPGIGCAEGDSLQI